MSYLVFCTFDLKDASAKDYQTAYTDLERLGLVKVHKGTRGNVVIPTTSTMGEFDGESAAVVCDALCSRIQESFSARKFKSELFVVVGGNWAWGSRITQ